MSEQPASTNDHVGQIIEGLDPGAFVTRYVLIAEVIGPDGTRGVWSQTHEDATRWDTYGLLMEALAAEQGAQVAAAVRVEMDDE